MKNTIAFDIYGTLINTHGLNDILQQHVGNQATLFSQLWRQKQLEYSFRRGLMQQYRDFAVCTAQALDYASRSFGISLAEHDANKLLNAYRALPIFDDVIDGVNNAKNAGFLLYAFSNGKASDIAALLDHAGISNLFLDIISVDEIQSFKPDPAVYHHFLARSSSEAQHTWLVSANPFDVIGASSIGMKSIWLQRSPDLLMDTWEIEPTITIHRLTDLAAAITASTTF